MCYQDRSCHKHMGPVPKNPKFAWILPKFARICPYFARVLPKFCLNSYIGKISQTTPMVAALDGGG